MSVYSDLEEFVNDHRAHGRLTPGADEPKTNGYRLTVTCPCGVTFERWVLLQDAEEDLLRSGLLGSEN